MTSNLADCRSAAWLRVAMAIFMVLLILAMFPYTAEPTSHIKVLLYTWAGVIFVAVWLVGAWLEKRALRLPRLLPVYVVLLLLVYAVSALSSSRVASSMVEVNKLFSFVLLYFVASDIYRSWRQVGRLMLVVCGATALASLYGFVQFAGLDPFPWADRTVQQYRDLPATFGNPNVAAHVLLLTTVLALVLVWEKSWRWVGLLAPLFLAHLYLTRCRASIAALGCALLLALVAVGLHKTKRGPAAALALTLAILVAGACAIPIASQLHHGRYTPLDGSTLFRYNSYFSAARMICDRPILGVGPGNYRIENTPYWTSYEREAYGRSRMMNTHVHNEPLELAADAGLLAVGLYFALILTGIWHGLALFCARAPSSERRMGLAFALFFAAFFVDSLAGFNLHVPVSATLFFVMAGAFEGLYAPAQVTPAPRTSPALAWRLILAALALTGTVLGTRVFASEVMLQRAAGAVVFNEFNAARDILERYEGLAPWNERFAIRRGDACQALNKPQEAVESYERALRNNPHAIEAMLKLARTYFNMWAQAPEDDALRNQAVAYAQAALALCPQLPNGDELLGRVAYLEARKLGEADGTAGPHWRDAEEHWVLALEHGVRNRGEILALLARVRTELGDRSGAEFAFTAALRETEVHPHTWPAYGHFAEHFDGANLLRSAVFKRQSQALSRGETLTPALEAAALAYNDNGGEKELFDASDLLVKSLQNPAFDRSRLPEIAWAGKLVLRALEDGKIEGKARSSTLLNLAMMFSATDETDTSLRLFGEVRPLLPPEYQIVCAIQHANLLMSLERYAEAEAALEGLPMSLTQTNHKYRLTRAAALAQNGKKMAARFEYRTILQEFRMDGQLRADIERRMSELDE